MSDRISFGIDLGTTNSLLGFSGSNGVEIFKNPVGHKETLPSCVAFRNGRTIIGEKARELIGKDPGNVFHSFKRKMGTGQTYFVESNTSFVSPIELSALVLKELKNFNFSGLPLTAAVITIPSSFDTLQSNATKEAGYQAGIEEVLLLQEPIAASLAFANKIADREKLEGKWLVYDLGGGTFDVALVEIGDEMRVLDHKGDNYLGGLDFDNLIIEKLIVPYLELKYSIDGLFDKMRNTGGAYNKLYYILQHKAEELKKELSVAETAELEFDFTDESGQLNDEYLNIRRADFEEIVRPKIQGTIDLVDALLKTNNLTAADIRQIVLVGGSTYIPLVRSLLAESIGVEVNNTIDPTTAIAIGAAYFASSKLRSTQVPAANTGTGEEKKKDSQFRIRYSYNKQTSDTDEVLVMLAEGDTAGYFYRVTRKDGGFDTGLIPLKNKNTVILSLLLKARNDFAFEIFDAANNSVYKEPQTIEVEQGTYSVYGQTLPNDICLEVDNVNSQNTRLEAVFAKNNLLPLKRTLTKTFSKTLLKGSSDSVLINMYEGDKFSRPASCIPLGHLQIKGTDLTGDIYRGSDVELIFEISESRDIKVLAYCISSGQEFSDIFKPMARSIDIERLKHEVAELKDDCEGTLNWALASQDYEKAAQHKAYQEELIHLEIELGRITQNDVTDSLYQIEERKRYYSQLFDAQHTQSTSSGFKEYYLSYKNDCRDLIYTRGDAKHKQQFEKIVAEEEKILAAASSYAIQAVINDMGRIVREIRKNDPDFIVQTFESLRSFREECFKDWSLAHKYFQMGERAFEERNYIELKTINNSITVQLKDEYLINDNYTNTGLK
ncbi:MAG TPA: Hsp70 family protein [Chitinophagales bacterium]|nr:Hsp70 family protein [Chitinophagales bacterium]